MGYKFQFITLAGFHQLNFGMFELARGYKERQMAAYSELQEAEFAAEANGYTATKHQREVGTGYFDAVSMAITGGQSSTTAMHESTEHAAVPAGGRIGETPERTTKEHRPMAPRTRVKERAEEQASAMSTDQQAAIRMLANDLHRLNQSVMKAVEAGVSVELVRSARHHGGDGNWGDLLIPVIVTQQSADA